MIKKEHRNFLRRDRENRCFMTFPNTTEAMKMEAVCHGAGLPGRLVPVPGEIMAGCGLAWMAERSWRKEMEKLAVLNGVTYEAVYEN